MLAQAIRRTKATAPRSSIILGRASATTSSCKAPTIIGWFVARRGWFLWFSSEAAMKESSSARASRTVAPGASRPMACR